MIDTIWARNIALAAIGFGLAAATVYYLMITVTLSHLGAISGLVPFDMRPLGYGPQDAAALPGQSHLNFDNVGELDS